MKEGKTKSNRKKKIPDKKLASSPPPTKRVLIKAVGDDNEPSDVTYTTKHGLTLIKPKNLSNVHFDITCQLAEKDPNFVKNCALGRYMPLQNGQRMHYRGKDAVNKFLYDLVIFVFFAIIFLVAIKAAIFILTEHNF